MQIIIHVLLLDKCDTCFCVAVAQCSVYMIALKLAKTDTSVFI